MKILLLLLLFSLKSDAQINTRFKIQTEKETAILFLKANSIILFEGKEILWKSAKQKCNLLADIKYPYAFIYLTDSDIRTIVISDTILMHYKKEWYTIFPGEYSVKKNDAYQYIICEVEVITSGDSIPVQQAHAYCPPW